MRVASTQFHITMNSALMKATDATNALLVKMATGQRFSLPSEDPIGSVRMSRLSREEAQLDQYLENITTLQSRLSKSESLLMGIQKDLLSARDLLVWAANGSNTSEDVRALSQSLSPLIESIFFDANARDAEGAYYYSGTATNTPTLAYDAAAPVGSRYTATGNTNRQAVVVGTGITQNANVVLPEMADLLNQLEDIFATLTTPGVNVNHPATAATITGGIEGVDRAIDVVNSRLAQLGSSQNMLETLQQNHTNVSLSNKQAAIIIGSLDYADATVKFNGYMESIQATQKAYVQVGKLSLFDAL